MDATTLAAGIEKLRAQAERHRQEVARLEKRPKSSRDLLHAKQALQLATVHEAVMREEMEVLDIACFARVALWKQ